MDSRRSCPRRPLNKAYGIAYNIVFAPNRSASIVNNFFVCVHDTLEKMSIVVNLGTVQTLERYVKDTYGMVSSGAPCPMNMVRRGTMSVDHGNTPFAVRKAKTDDILDLVRMRLALQQHMEKVNDRMLKHSETWELGLPAFYSRQIDSRDSIVLIATWTALGFRPAVKSCVLTVD